ncbi:MAG TPA: SRPBCC domain-containing protein [Anaerolineaceae bacterium]
MPETTAVQLECLVNAPPAEAFRAFTHATALRDWLSVAAHSAPGKKGYYFLQWGDQTTVQGVYSRYEPGKSLEFSWQALGDSDPDRVEITFQPVEEGTRVLLTHHVCGTGAGVDLIRNAWGRSLENLQSFLETGIDLRLARRPRIGILIDEMNAEVAARLGTPVKEGVRIGGTMEGSGAQRAGIQKDDVMIRLDGHPTPDFNALAPIVQKHQVGDRVMAVLYRGADLVEVELEFSKNPLPEYPASGVELAQVARTTYAGVLQGLRDLTVDLTDPQASFKPAPQEWSVKEIVAHFILCERDYQSWTADMLNDTPINDYLQYRPNVNERINALLQRFGTLPALLDELGLAYNESAEMLAALPEGFTRWRKHLYRRVAEWALIITPGHFNDEHSGQIQRAIQAALAE